LFNKRRRQLDPHAMVSEGQESMKCASLSVVLLIRLGANAAAAW
jgi:hypothetical protein